MQFSRCGKVPAGSFNTYSIMQDSPFTRKTEKMGCRGRIKVVGSLQESHAGTLLIYHFHQAAGFGFRFTTTVIWGAPSPPSIAMMCWQHPPCLLTWRGRTCPPHPPPVPPFCNTVHTHPHLQNIHTLVQLPRSFHSSCNRSSHLTARADRQASLLCTEIPRDGRNWILQDSRSWTATSGMTDLESMHGQQPLSGKYR